MDYSNLLNNALYKIIRTQILKYLFTNICTYSYSEFLHAYSYYGQYLIQKIPIIISCRE
jgi:hypothetical protein